MGWDPLKKARKALRGLDRSVRRGLRSFDRGFLRPIGDLLGLQHVPDFPDIPPQLITRRGSNHKLPIPYGQNRIAGIEYPIGTTGSNNEYLWVIFVLGEGELESIDQVWIDDYKSTDKRYANNVYIPKDSDATVSARTRYGWVGTTTQAAPADLVSAFTDFTSSMQGKGVAYVLIRFKFDDKYFVQGQIPKCEFDVRGVRCYDSRSSSTIYTTNPAIILEDYLTNSRYGKGLAQGQDDTRREAAADNCDNLMDSRTSMPTGYKINHAIGYAAGVSSIVLDTGTNAPVRGDAFRIGTISGSVFTPSDSTVYTVESVSGTGPNYTLTFSPEARTAFADNADLSFQIAYFEINGVIDTSKTMLENVKLIASAFRGMLPLVNGLFATKMRGFDDTSVYSLTTAAMQGGLSWQRSGKQFLKNRVVGSFANPINRWAIDKVVADSSAYLTTDNNIALVGELNMSLENNPYRALFRCETVLKESRNDLTLTVSGPVWLWQIETGDIVTLTYTSHGFSAQKFRVTKMQLIGLNEVIMTMQKHTDTDYNRTVPAGYTARTDQTIPQKFNHLVRQSSREIMLSNWTERANPATNQDLYSITGEQGSYLVAVGLDDGTNPYILYSTDGINWSQVTPTTARAFPLNAVCYDGYGYWVAVGAALGSVAYILSTTDPTGVGYAWTERTNPKNFSLVAVLGCGTNGILACGGPDGTDSYVIISTNSGNTWAELGNPKNYWLRHIAYDDKNDVIYMAGDTDGADGYMIAFDSNDLGLGYTTTEIANPQNLNINGIACHDGRIVIIYTGSGGYQTIAYSDDAGTNWTSQQVTDNNYGGLKYLDGLWIAFGGSVGGVATILTSVDGETWSTRSSPGTDVIYDLGFAENLNVFAIVGYAPSGKDALIMTSLFGK